MPNDSLGQLLPGPLMLCSAPLPAVIPQSLARIDDLRLPPSSRLEALKGDRAGQYSIRINDQRRARFRFAAGDALDVKITDYH